MLLMHFEQGLEVRLHGVEWWKEDERYGAHGSLNERTEGHGQKGQRGGEEQTQSHDKSRKFGLAPWKMPVQLWW